MHIYNIFIKAVATLIVILALLVGCGGNALKTHEHLLKYVEDFNAEAAARGVSVRSVVANFGTLSRPTIGTCSGGIITIDLEWWQKADAASREALVWHEMGHCALGLGHIEGEATAYNPDIDAQVRLPLSVMQAKFIGGYAWTLARARYIEALFK